MIDQQDPANPNRNPRLNPNESRLPGPMIIVFTVLIILIIIALLALFVWK